jgi:undecaprenyl phosphate-alpha-L-ara4N flippase subunit ArnF
LSLIVAVLASAAAQLLLKTGVLLLAMPTGLWWVAGGLACYAVAMLAWLHVLTRLPLSVAYPMLGVSYVLVYVGAMASPLLSEAFTPTRATGVLLVTCGVGLISASTNGKRSA